MDKTQLEQDAVTAIGKTGVPVTPLLRDITMAAIDTARRQRTPDYPLHSLIKDAVHTTVAHAGPRRAVSAMEQNERMAALRPFGLDVPTNPSVQDVAVAVLELCVEGAVREALVRRTTRLEDELMDLIADFCRDHHALNNTPPKRRQAQEKVLREFELSLAERPLTEAGTEELERFLIAELERGLHVNTVRFELNMIRPFYTWLWRRQYIDGDRLLRIRDVRPPRGASGRSTPKPYDRRELDRFYAELDERWPRSSDNMVQRWKQGRSTYHRVWKHGMRLQIDAIIALALYQGMRGKEIYDATEDDVHPLNRYVIVRYGTRKGDGRQKYREVPMQERTRAAIGAWLEWRAMLKPGHDSLWLSLHPRWALIPMRYSRIRHLLLTIGGGWQLHRFRHTCATEWLRAGMPLKHVSRWLGHSTVSRTECYVQIIRDDLEREATRAASNFDRAVAPRQEAA